MEDYYTLRDLKQFLKSHKAIKRYVFAKEAGISRFSFMRVTRGETPFEKYHDDIIRVMVKYGFEK